MRKSIDMNKLRKDAKAKQVNLYILVKREIGYRKTNFKDLGQNCFNCRMSEMVKFQSGIKDACCHVIGIMCDTNAFVSPNNICRFHSKCPYKNLKAEEIE